MQQTYEPRWFYRKFAWKIRALRSPNGGLLKILWKIEKDINNYSILLKKISIKKFLDNGEQKCLLLW